MAGNDRTFTRTERDFSRQVDDTSPANPIMMNMRVGSHFYGKRRQEITISLLNEAYTCIPIRPLAMRQSNADAVTQAGRIGRAV